MNTQTKELVESCLSFINDLKGDKKAKPYQERIALALIEAFDDVERDAKTGNLVLDT